MAAHLGAWDVAFDVTADAEAAGARLEDAVRQGDPYDLAVIGVAGPGSDGLGLAGRIAANPRLAGTGLLLVGVPPGQASAPGLARAVCMAKPLRFSQLFAHLEQAITTRAVPPVARAVSSVAVSDLGWLLVVEDNAINQRVATGIAAQLGYRCDLAANGIEALEALAGKRYAAVLMDCHMPAMDGFQATMEVRRREGGGRRTPIIALTASAMAKDRDECLAAGMDDHLSKPINPRQLAAILTRWADGTPPMSAPWT